MITQALKPELQFAIPPTFEEVLAKSSGSAAGYHAVSEWMTCPERARLHKLGLRLKDFDGDGNLRQARPRELTALDFGTLAHHIRAIRVAFGHQRAMETLDSYRHEIGDASYLKAATLFGAYEQTVPRDTDPLEYLAIEQEVISNLAAADQRPVLRTVRYDTVVYAHTINGERELYSFEAKTMSRSGPGSIDPYNPQGMVQVALWNANPNLVAQYGEMAGVIFDCMIKTKTPSTDRVPRYYSKKQQAMALAYMRLPEPDSGSVKFMIGPNGEHPKMLHACWGRWQPCVYIHKCHDGAEEMYEAVQRNTGGDDE